MIVERAAKSALKIYATPNRLKEKKKMTDDDITAAFNKFRAWMKAEREITSFTPLEAFRAGVHAAQVAASQPAQEPTMVCSQCGADRFKEDCKGDRMRCDIRGTAQGGERHKVPCSADDAKICASPAYCHYNGCREPAQGSAPAPCEMLASQPAQGEPQGAGQ